MTNDEFKEQVDYFWTKPVLPPFVTSPFRGRTTGPNGIRMHYSLLHIDGDPPQMERFIVFELRDGRIFHRNDDGSRETELPDVQAVGIEMQKFVDAFVADCHKRAPAGPLNGEAEGLNSHHERI
jgi:hypothetical protein